MVLVIKQLIKSTVHMTQNSSTSYFIDAFYDVSQVFLTFESKYDLLKCGYSTGNEEFNSFSHLNEATFTIKWIELGRPLGQRTLKT